MFRSLVQSRSARDGGRCVTTARCRRVAGGEARVGDRVQEIRTTFAMEKTESLRGWTGRDEKVHTLSETDERPVVKLFKRRMTCMASNPVSPLSHQLFSLLLSSTLPCSLIARGPDPPFALLCTEQLSRSCSVPC